MPLPTLPTNSLFDLYKKEKESMDDELDPFPKFKAWKEIYLRERQEEMDDINIINILLMDDEEATKHLEDDTTTVVPKVATKIVPPTKPKVKSTKTKPLTNMDRARTIFQQLVDAAEEMPTRKEVMTAFMDQLKVSKACSSTYHHNIKQKYV